MIISCTAMNKNERLDQLARELESLDALLQQPLDGEGKSVILSRLLKGVSPETWLLTRRKNRLKDWHAIPANGMADSWEDGLVLSNGDEVPVTPFREIHGIITKHMFMEALGEELKRLSRNGGALSLLSVGLVGADHLEKAYGAATLGYLEALLASVFLSFMDLCDCMGIMRKGQFLCCLFGLGQLAARSLAEKAQTEFMKKISTTMPDFTPVSEVPVQCAVGIVNISQGEDGNAKTLINRSSIALEMAIGRVGHIFQESAASPLDNATLVQSSEKQFLFFGSSKS